MAAVMATLVLTSIAAATGCAAFAFVMGCLGARITIAPAAYAISAMVAISSPLIAIFASFMLPVRSLLVCQIVSELCTQAQHMRPGILH